VLHTPDGRDHGRRHHGRSSSPPEADARNPKKVRPLAQADRAASASQLTIASGCMSFFLVTCARTVGKVSRSDQNETERVDRRCQLFLTLSPPAGRATRVSALQTCVPTHASTNDRGD